MAIKKGTSKLRPRARIIRTIGEELISNDIVAIIELVKNSYDADAKKVNITFSGELYKKDDVKDPNPYLFPKGKGEIIIEDDGSGMSLDTIRKGWMEPATIIKKVKSKSSKGRRFLGEKGVGRFASARLSQQLEMITRSKGDSEIYAVFNWAEFSDDNKYLDEIDCSWEVRDASAIKNHGTILTLKNVNLDWDYEKLCRLHTALSRLMSPVAPAKDFSIELKLPKEFSSLSGAITPPASLGKPGYHIKGNVDGRGLASFDYYSMNKDSKEQIRKKVILKPSREPISGPFNFEFRVWDREQESLEVLADAVKSTVRDVRRDLNEASGISVYRDGFRVFPYGEQKNDWLRLDLRRVQNPTMRLSNNQIVGYVSVSLDDNPALTDQSNREGIVESQAFVDLQEMIISVISELETRRYHERPRREEKDSSEGIFSSINIDPVAELVQKKLPDDEEAKNVVNETKKQIQKGLQHVQEVLARYRRLSTLGQLVDVVLHDGNGILLRIDNEVQLLDKEFTKKTINADAVKKHISVIRQERKVLAELFKRLEPFSGRKRGRPAEIIIEDAIRNVFELYQKEINEQQIKVSLPGSKTQVKFDESEFEMIIVNLLQNSLYWLETMDAKNRKICVEIQKSEDSLTLIFSDSGPGVDEGDVLSIFNPYFSKKPDGIGLGLTIIGELVAEYNGSFELLSSGPLAGATFRITFRRRV